MGSSSPCRFVGRQADDAKVNWRHYGKDYGIVVNFDAKIGSELGLGLYIGEFIKEDEKNALLYSPIRLRHADC